MNIWKLQSTEAWYVNSSTTTVKKGQHYLLAFKSSVAKDTLQPIKTFNNTIGIQPYTFICTVLHEQWQEEQQQETGKWMVDGQ